MSAIWRHAMVTLDSPRLRIQNANAICSLLTHGSAITAFIGSMWARWSVGRSNCR